MGSAACYCPGQRYKHVPCEVSWGDVKEYKSFPASYLSTYIIVLISHERGNLGKG
jgi:hypothetical protein